MQGKSRGFRYGVEAGTGNRPKRRIKINRERPETHGNIPISNLVISVPCHFFILKSFEYSRAKPVVRLEAEPGSFLPVAMKYLTKGLIMMSP